ncbi:hypothetical protein [Capnocytophaga cynodegmi]|uniref:hypothetical protein n=1 Tax=Capnocytophaga cynodegmi TaxID=28189 RepID=UPI0003612F1E|nr:hypothetical protein [Capnocytophaga cynodegmi]
MIVEALWRLSHPIFVIEGSGKDYRDIEGMLFYAYKFSSIMFIDSNFVGTYGLIAFFYYFFLLRKKYVRSKKPLLIIAILIVTTLSRSAIITVPITISFIYLLTIKVRLHHILTGMIFFTMLILFIAPRLANDLSFLSKFEILDLTYKYLQECSLGEFLFGIGFGNTVKYLGIGAHNLFVTHLVESGLIGLTFFLAINLILIRPTQKYSLYLTIPLFISGMSLVGHAISYYYACLALIYVLQFNERKNIGLNTNL